MNKSNYFQKGVVLIIAILLAIPNMRTYLIIGSYKIYSQALTENNYFEHSYSVEKKSQKSLFTSLATLGFTLFIIAFAVAFSSVYEAQNQGSIGRDIYVGRHILKFNTFDSSYRKYDFSEFDNYTPSSMKPEF